MPESPPEQPPSHIAKDIKGSLLELGKAGVSVAGSAANTAAGVAANVAADAAPVAGQMARSAASAAQEKAVEALAASKERAAELVAQLRAAIEKWGKQKVYAFIEKHVVERLPGLAKELLEDPQMPRCVSRGKDRLVDGAWPDVHDELMWELAVFLDGQKKDEAVEVSSSGACCLLAFLRYHLLPYDKGFWGKLRDPWWLLLIAISLVPVSGVSPMFYFFVFLIIDKRDEFQIVQFILAFKGTQFLSTGIIRGIVGLSLFVACVTAEAHDDDHSCETKGPGNASGFWATMAGFVIQVLLCWLAFFWLNCAQGKGRSRLKGDLEPSRKLTYTRPGGYIRYLLIYDLLAALPCIGVWLWAASTRPGFKLDDWVAGNVVVASQIVYGLVSFPFFFFTLPGLQKVLTHAAPTGYDRRGVCRPPQRRAKDDKKEEPKAKEPPSEPFMTDDEAESMLRRLRANLGVPV